MANPISFTQDGTLYEGFRPYEGKLDHHNPRTLQGPRRYGLAITICSIDKETHSVWTVIDSNIFIQAFESYIKRHFPKVNYIRYLRSRT